MKVTVLAVTKMYTGFCVAGINEKGRWVRLIPRGGYNLTSLKYRDGSYLQVADILEIDGEWKYTQAPHIEDYSCANIKKISKLTNQQLWAFCEKHKEDEQSLVAILNKKNKSLCLIQVEKVNCVYSSRESPLSARLAFYAHNKWYRNNTVKPGFPCTCLRWRTMQRQGLTLPHIWKEKPYLAIGLTRGFTDEEGIYVPPAPMVISIISNPPLPGEINYNNP